MKRKKIAVLVVIVVLILLLAVVIMAAIGGHDTPKPTDPTNTPTVPTTQGADPTQDTEPTVPPTEPTDPDVPTDPTDPEGPTDPTDPTDPAGPTDPTDPTEPDQPTDPTEPEKPTEPTEPVHSHDYKAEQKVEPTCTEEGYTLYVCECGDSYHGANVAALGHSNEEKVTEPTCEKEGYTTYTCVRCGHTEKGNTVKAKGHAYGEWSVETEPTCEKEGTNVRTCATCGKKDKEDIAALGHEMHVAEQVEPTCTADGYIKSVCSNCDKTTYTEIFATGHKWSEWETIQEPTDEEDGKRKRTCTVCGKEETQAISHEHVHVWASRTVQPGEGCLDHGYILWYCSVCGEELEKEYKTALLAPGHDWSEWEVSQEPGPGVAGEEKRHCKRCGIEETLPIEPLDENGKKLESYIDPKVEQKTSIAGNPRYYYGDIIVSDQRKTWGEYISITVNEDDSLTVVFYNKEGERVEVLIELMEAYDLTVLDIYEDGTYDLYGFNGFN